MVYAKAAKMAPRELAERITTELGDANVPHLERAEVAGPGFVNVYLSPSWLHEVLATVVREGPGGYARPALGNGATVNIEFVSANPTGPLHAGGGRWGAYGDSLARLFRRCGYQTHTEYYVNDRGTQMELFGRSLAARVAGEPVPDDGYHGEYVREWAAELADDLADQLATFRMTLVDEDEVREFLQQHSAAVFEFLSGVAGRRAEARSPGRRAFVPTGPIDPDVRDLLQRELEARGGVAYAAEWGRERALRDVDGVLAAMNVSFDHWQSEAALVESGVMDDAIERLGEAGWVYEQDGAKWLATSELGDTKDRVLVRSDGMPTYFLPDIAYHHAKFGRDGRDIERVIDVLGADHHGYVPRVAAAMQMLGHPRESYEAVVGQNVTLMRDGHVLELSKRTGTMVEVRELIDAVGPDVARFAFLLQSIDTRQTIDIDLLCAQATENPVFYVQYAHARIASVQRRARTEGVDSAPADDIDLTLAVSEREIALMRALEVLPSVVELALRERAPHKVATWVRDLAAAFHGFYHDCPILRSDVPPELRDARLCLTEGTRIGLAIGLDLLGVNAPEQM